MSVDWSLIPTLSEARAIYQHDVYPRPQARVCLELARCMYLHIKRPEEVDHYVASRIYDLFKVDGAWREEQHPSIGEPVYYIPGPILVGFGGKLNPPDWWPRCRVTDGVAYYSRCCPNNACATNLMRSVYLEMANWSMTEARNRLLADGIAEAERAV